MTDTTGTLIGAAVHDNAERPSLGERVFARLFHGLVYAQIWEDPVCDMYALDLRPDDHITCIASGGCNMMSYLTARPAAITAVDLSPWHVRLNRLKLTAAQALPDHASFYDLFGHADRPSNNALFDRYLLPQMSAEDRAFWTSGQGRQPRKTMFARSFYRFGALGGFIAMLHHICRLSGVRFDALLRAQSLDEQRAFFDLHIAPLFDTWVVKAVARQRSSLFGLGIPPAQYDKLAADAEGDILRVLRDRTRKLFCDFPISDNYFAWQAANRGYKGDGTGPVPPYLEARHFDTLREMAPRVSVLNRSITKALADAPAASRSVYVLLDAQDWMSDAQLSALWQEITRTARPGARVLFRTGGATNILPGRVPADLLDQWRYDEDASTHAFATDRSAIYGGVHLYRKV